MIVNPYAELDSLADQIRNYTQGDFPTALVSANAAIVSMLAGDESEPQPAPPSWRHRLRHWIIQTFLVAPGIAEAAVEVIVGDPAPGYTTTAKAIEGEFSQYQSYDKAVMIPSGNSNYCTFACFMRIPHKTANYEGFIFGNLFCNFWTRNFGWYGGTAFPNLPNTIYINLNDVSYNDYYGVSQDLSVHGIDVGDWFALMISADLSASPAEVKIFVQKVGESTAADISIVTPWGDDSPILMQFDSAGGSICAMNSHPNFTTQSLDSEVCELYFSNELVDWTDSAVKDLYIDPVTGKPVGLTAGGANLTGTAAAYYIPDGNGTINEGTAGNFTEENGPIIDAATSPTD